MTNWFEIYYSELLNFATSLVVKRKLPIEPEDLINDAYIKFFELGEPFSLSLIRRITTSAAFKELENKYAKNSYDEAYVKIAYKDLSHQTCINCKEAKPQNHFRFRKEKGFNYIRGICLECEAKKKQEWFEENRDKWNDYMRGYRQRTQPKQNKRQAQPIHDLWKKANHTYIEKQRETLSDVYIRSLLRGKSITPETIERKRLELMAKRNVFFTPPLKK